MGTLLDTASYDMTRRTAFFVYHEFMADMPEIMTAAPSLTEVPDRALVAHARQGNERAFEELVRRYRNDAYRLAYHFVHDREEAWDVSQEAFIKAYRALWRFRGEAQFKTWLMHIVANQCRDHLRRQRTPVDAQTRERVRVVSLNEGPSQEYTAPSGEPDQIAETHELGQAIEQALASLPHKHRAAFILREYEGLSYEEMARVMGCRMGTVMSRLHHARRKLQEKLVEAGVWRDVEDGYHG